MTRKQTRMLRRILISVATLAVVWVLCAFVPLPWYAQLALYLIPYLIIGYDVLRKAFLGVVQGEIFDENFLMAIATVGALALQEYREAAAVMLFYQIGELFQSYAVGKSRKNIAALMDIRPDYANLETGDGVQQVDPDTVAVGDVILIRPGEKIPLDGVVLEGSGTINTSALTGESRPRRVSPGDDVISGCVNQDEVLRVKVSKPFGQSTVARILELVENSSLKKAKAENFITKFARYYTPAVCIGAAALAILPSLFTGQWGVWVSRALTFLVISCPCALVISIPLTFFGGIGGASRSGILIKGGNYLEALAQVKTIVFDKTGTLTQGVFQVTGVFPAEGFTEDTLLETAALAESWSNHPIAQSLRAAWGKPLDSSRTRQVHEEAGHGLTAQVDGVPVAAGNARLMAQQGVQIPQNSKPAEGATVVYLAINGTYAGFLQISDVEKPTSAQAIQSLKRQGIRTVMLTGDAEAAAHQVARRLGLDDYHAQLLPGDKVEKLEQLLNAKAPNSTLAFVGDGINDAPVLRRADVGIAMGSLGSDAAIEAADVVLMDDDPAKLPLALRIARKCRRIVYQNIVFALAVKFLCLILGAVGIANMWWAVFADVGVMVLAVLNATRMLRPVKPE
ncbi:cadmium-translocating P-type ATPase [Gemmiger sp. An87]|nr:cadmium-translocating P-type ATPase [Gemmiger sp. An87]